MKIISPFPEFREAYNYDCGAAALQSVLDYYGLDVRLGELMKKAGTNYDDGTTVVSIIKTAKAYGLRAVCENMTIAKIKEHIDKDIPVIIPLQAWTEKEDLSDVNWEKDWVDGHYVVAIGYDKDKLYFEDPSTPVRDFLTFDEFEKRWHDHDDKKKYVSCGIVIYGKPKKQYKPERAIHMD